MGGKKIKGVWILCLIMMEMTIEIMVQLSVI